MTIFQQLAHLLPMKINNTNANAKAPNFNRRLGENISFSLPTITEDFVYSQIKSMPNGKATGIDEISVRLLKAGADAIVPILTWIMNLSITSDNYGNYAGRF